MPMDFRNLKKSTLFPGFYMGKCIVCGEGYESEKRNPKCDDCWNAPITREEMGAMFGTRMPIEAAGVWSGGPQEGEQTYHVREKLANMAKAWKQENAEKYGTKIVAAAIRYRNLRYPNGEEMPELILSVPAPGRHHNCFHCLAALDRNLAQNLAGCEEQGFITDKGVFVDRDMAGWIASEAKQTLDGKPKSHLFSEDLW